MGEPVGEHSAASNDDRLDVRMASGGCYRGQAGSQAGDGLL